ncbi:MAG: hypothetical protein AB1486_16505 [Planctomycetota bacterium]
MTDSFTQRLRSIRQQRTEESARHSPERSEEVLRRSEVTARCFAFRERVQDIIENFIERFRGEVSGFEVSKGFYESKYSISISADQLMVDARGEPDKFFSRVTFLLAPCATTETLELVCKQTVRNRDLETDKVVASFAAGEIAPFAAFVERQFLRFAEAYFTADGTRPIETTDSPSPARHPSRESEPV